MTPTRLQEALNAIGVETQSEAGNFLGYDQRTVRRWLSGELPVPRIVALLLEIMMFKRVSTKRADQLFDRGKK
jgi:hypothetical protein